MQALLELHTITPFTIIDLCLSVFRAWLDPSYHRTSLRILRRRIYIAGALMGLSVGVFLFAAMGWIQASDVNAPAGLDTLATVFSGLATALLTPIGLFGELIAFSSLLLVPLMVIAQKTLLRDRKPASRMAFLRLLPAALALFFLCIPRTLIPAFLGVSDWGFNCFLLLTLMSVAGELTVYVLSEGKTWLERNGSRLIMSVSGFIMAACAFNVIWTWTAWGWYSGWQWSTGLLIQVIVMVLATALAALSLVLSLGVSHQLRVKSPQTS
jgi:hypothetical protein